MAEAIPINKEPPIIEDTLLLDDRRLKEKRRLRNEQKKELGRNQKLKEQELEMLLKLQPKSNNLTLVTRDFADWVIGNNSTPHLPCNQQLNRGDLDFPELGSVSKVTTYKSNELLSKMHTEINDKHRQKVGLLDFLRAPVQLPQKKPITSHPVAYHGNMLDSDMPVRRKGKYREIPKIKRPSKLKQAILDENSQELSTVATRPQPSLCDNVITNELNELVTTFISALVRLQEKFYKRDPIKGALKRRYIVGLHEAKKYLNLNKVKFLIIAPDIKIIKCDGVLDSTLKQVITMAQTNKVPYTFALKRRSLGILTLKYVPISLIGVLNYEGIEGQFKPIMELLPSLKEQYVQNNDLQVVDLSKELAANLMKSLKRE